MVCVESIKFRGFKNIEEVVIDFSSSDIIAFISQNNYGKSNVLSALSFVSGYINAPRKVRNQMMSDSEYVPLNKKIEDEDFFTEIVFSYYTEDIKCYAAYGFSFEWEKTNNDGGSIITEWLMQKTDEKKQKYQQLIKREKDVCLYKSSEKGRCSSKVRLDADELGVERLLAYDSLYYRDLLYEIRNLHFFCETHLDANFAYEVSPFSRKSIGPHDLVRDNHQLAKALYNLKMKDSKLYNQICAKCKELFPEILQLNVEKIPIETKFGADIPKDAPFMVDNSIYVLFYEDKHINQPISFEYISDGVKRVMFLLTNMALAKKNNISLFAIEEPENSIHPKLLERYINALCDYSSEFRIILTSHSPYLVNYLGIKNVLLGLPDDYGRANFQRVDNYKAYTNYCDSRDESEGECVFNMLNENEEKLFEFWSD